MARGRWQRTDEGVEDTLELGGTRAEVACDSRWRRVARHVEGIVGQAAGGGGGVGGTGGKGGGCGDSVMHGHRRFASVVLDA